MVPGKYKTRSVNRKTNASAESALGLGSVGLGFATRP